MRTYYNIYLSGFKVGQYLLRFFCTTGSREVFHTYRQSFQTRGERLVMLVGKHGGGHQHGHLLGIAGCLESGAHGHLGLSEAHVSTDQTVHRTGTFHIGLHVVGSLQLVGRVLIKERSLQFVLHEGIGAEGKSPLSPAGSIEFYQVAGNILYLGFRPLLHPFPGTCSKGGKARLGLAVLTLVFRNLVERMDAHVHLIIICIDDADDLLILLGVGGRVLGVGGNDGHSYQSGKLSYAQIHVHDIVAGLHLLQFLHRERHLAVAGSIRTEVVFMITVEYLVVGKEAEFQRVVGKTLVERMVNGGEGDGCWVMGVGGLRLGCKRFKDVLQTLLLLLTVGQDIQFVAFQQIVLQSRNQQLEILVEERLRSDFTMHGGLCLPFHPCAEAHFAEALHISIQLRCRQQFPFCLHLLQNLLLLHLRNPF